MENSSAYELGRLVGAASFGVLAGLLVWGLRALVARLRPAATRPRARQRAASSLTVGFALAVLGTLPAAAAGAGGGMLLVALVGLIAGFVWWLRVRSPGPKPEAELPPGADVT